MGGVILDEFVYREDGLRRLPLVAIGHRQHFFMVVLQGAFRRNLNKSIFAIVEGLAGSGRV